MPRFSIVCLLTLGSLIYASDAPSEEISNPVREPNYAIARKHFLAGTEHLKASRFAEAVLEFDKAYSLTLDGVVQGHIADAYARAGDYQGAIQALKLYREALREVDRAPVDTLIQKHQEKIKANETQPLFVPTSSPSVEAKASAKASHPKTQTNPAPKQEDAQRIEKNKVPVSPPVEKPDRVYTWIAAGAAGAFAGAALVLGLNAKSRYDELRDRCMDDCAPSEVDSLKTRAMVTDVLWGASLAAVITTGVLWFLEGRTASLSNQQDLDAIREKRHIRIGVAPVLSHGRIGMQGGIEF